MDAHHVISHLCALTKAPFLIVVQNFPAVVGIVLLFTSAAQVAMLHPLPLAVQVLLLVVLPPAHPLAVVLSVILILPTVQVVPSSVATVLLQNVLLVPSLVLLLNLVPSLNVV